MSECARQLIRHDTSAEHWSVLAAAIRSILGQNSGNDETIQKQLSQLVNDSYPACITDPVLVQATAKCPSRQEISTPSWSKTLHQDNNCHIALLAVYKGMQMPLHDHTDSLAVCIVLSGCAQIHTASCLRLDQATGMAEIEISESKEFTEQEVCWNDADKNLHSIEAKTDIARLLIVHTPKVEREKQAFYFPLEDKSWTSGQHISCKRIWLRHNVGH